MPYPPPGDFPNPGIEPRSPTLKAGSLLSEPPGILSHQEYIQEYWSGQPITSPGDLPDPGIELGSPALLADSLPADLPGKSSNLLAHLHAMQCYQLSHHILH